MSSTPRLSPVQHTALMCCAEVFSMTGFAAYTTLLPVLQREWGFTNSEAERIQTTIEPPRRQDAERIRIDDETADQR